MQDRKRRLWSPYWGDLSDTEEYYAAIKLILQVPQISSKGKTKIDIAQIDFASSILWAIAVAMIRSSIIFLYIRIFPSRSFRLACYSILTLNVAFSTGVVVADFLECRPVACQWDPSVACTSCFKQVILEKLQAGFSLTLDITVVFLPTPMLWGLQMPARKKALLSGMFGLGIL